LKLPHCENTILILPFTEDLREMAHSTPCRAALDEDRADQSGDDPELPWLPRAGLAEELLTAIDGDQTVNSGPATAG
jgi:hypothetical protein